MNALFSSHPPAYFSFFLDKSNSPEPPVHIEHQKSSWNILLQQNFVILLQSVS